MAKAALFREGKNIKIKKNTSPEGLLTLKGKRYFPFCLSDQRIPATQTGKIMHVASFLDLFFCAHVVVFSQLLFLLSKVTVDTHWILLSSHCLGLCHFTLSFIQPWNIIMTSCSSQNPCSTEFRRKLIMTFYTLIICSWIPPAEESDR